MCIKIFMFWIFFKVRSAAGGIKLNPWVFAISLEICYLSFSISALLRSNSFNFPRKYLLGFLFIFRLAFSLVRHGKDPFFFFRLRLFSVLLFIAKFFHGRFLFRGFLFLSSGVR